MQGRTFFRIMIENLFINNIFCKTLSALVNFCKEQSFYYRKELKFLQKMPLKKVENKSSYDKRFIFTSNTNSGVNLK